MELVRIIKKMYNRVKEILHIFKSVINYYEIIGVVIKEGLYG